MSVSAARRPSAQKRRGRNQLALGFRPRGGKRRGAGRKPKGDKAGVSHLARERFSRRTPVHVTLRLVEGLQTLRKPERALALKAAFCAAKERFGLRIVQLSVQGNHIHLLVEADDNKCLALGMQALNIRLARALNRRFGRRGKLFADRYHAHILETPTEVKRTLVYLLNNFRRHAAQARGARLLIAPDWIDPYSSARYFDGWRDRPPDLDLRALEADPREQTQSLLRTIPVVSATSWLLRQGWRRRGLLALDATPGPSARSMCRGT